MKFSARAVALVLAAAATSSAFQPFSQRPDSSRILVLQSSYLDSLNSNSNNEYNQESYAQQISREFETMDPSVAFPDSGVQMQPEQQPQYDTTSNVPLVFEATPSFPPPEEPVEHGPSPYFPPTPQSSTMMRGAPEKTEEALYAAAKEPTSIQDAGWQRQDSKTVKTNLDQFASYSSQQDSEWYELPTPPQSSQNADNAVSYEFKPPFHDLEKEQNAYYDSTAAAREAAQRNQQQQEEQVNSNPFASYYQAQQQQQQIEQDLRQQLEQERQREEELRLQLEQERQQEEELRLQIEQERQQEEELRLQLEQERRREEELRRQLEQERERQQEEELRLQIEQERQQEEELRLQLEQERQREEELRRQLEQEREVRFQLEQQRQQQAQEQVNANPFASFYEEQRTKAQQTPAAAPQDSLKSAKSSAPPSGQDPFAAYYEKQRQLSQQQAPDTYTTASWYSPPAVEEPAVEKKKPVAKPPPLDSNMLSGWVAKDDSVNSYFDGPSLSLPGEEVESSEPAKLEPTPPSTPPPLTNQGLTMPVTSVPSTSVDSPAPSFEKAQPAAYSYNPPAPAVTPPVQEATIPPAEAIDSAMDAYLAAFSLLSTPPPAVTPVSPPPVVDQPPPVSASPVQAEKEEVVLTPAVVPAPTAEAKSSESGEGFYFGTLLEKQKKMTPPSNVPEDASLENGGPKSFAGNLLKTFGFGKPSGPTESVAAKNENKIMSPSEGIAIFERAFRGIQDNAAVTREEESAVQQQQDQKLNLEGIQDSRGFDPDDPSTLIDTVGMNERIMRSIPAETQAGGAGGSSTWEAFLKAEKNWAQLKASKAFTYDSKSMGTVDRKGFAPPPQFVTQDVAVGNPQCWTKLREQNGKALDYDVIMCGGTLGIFFAAALQAKGHRVCVLEAGKLRGREQEWNISMDELIELIKIGILTVQDVDAAIKTDFPGCRSGFKNKEISPLSGGFFDNGIGFECETEDVLNLGVSPAVLIERAAQKFKAKGGVILEDTRLQGVAISETIGAAVDLGEQNEPLTSRLVIDCMGNASPISKQQRHGQKPDGVCVVVGSCASGYDPKTNLRGDLIYTFQKLVDKGPKGKMQYFWESFPVGIGENGVEPGTSDVKTTYMFTYMDAHPDRPSLEDIMEDYWKLLPVYQPSITNPETDLDVKRVLFAFFPTYEDSPLKPAWNRVLAVGDASGIQSPLSFGGFGALTRHLDRITTAIGEALDGDLLHKDDLGEINAYTPNLSATWMFQKAMSVKMGKRANPEFVNRLLATNFEVMDDMGKRTIKPFLQDVVRFDGLAGSLTRSFAKDPLFMPQIVTHVGLPRLVDWAGHVYNMGCYSFLDTVASPVVDSASSSIQDERTRYVWRRRMDAWKYGSGNDYMLPKDN